MFEAMEIKIERGIPIPPKSKNFSRYKWDQMVIGDSFLLPPDSSPDKINSARNAAYGFGKRHKMKFTSRTTNKGTRIWRTE